MYRVGLIILTAGFMGILAFLMLGITRSLPVALATHAGLFLTVVIFSIKKGSGLLHAKEAKIETLYYIHPFFIVLAGLAFIAGGLYIALFAESGNETNSMTVTDQIYFGSIFTMLGGGLTLIAASIWISRK